MSALEKLHFKIGLSGTYWDKVPEFNILVNTTEYAVGYLSEPSGEVQYFEFDAEVPEGDTVLSIGFLNKTNSDVVKDQYDTDDFTIINDLLLHIVSVEIDEIDLGSLLYTKSIFVATDPDRPALEKCIDLGWNGVWTLKFESPYYLWLLENL